VQIEGTKARRSTFYCSQCQLAGLIQKGCAPADHFHWLSCRENVQPQHIGKRGRPAGFTISVISLSVGCHFPRVAVIFASGLTIISPRARLPSTAHVPSLGALLSHRCLAEPVKTLNVSRVFTDAQ